MAINRNNESANMLNRPSAQLAVLISGGLCLLAAAGVFVHLLKGLNTSAATVLAMLCWAVVAILLVVFHVSLRKAQNWAQQTLLAFWLLLAVMTGMLSLISIIWGAPSWWAQLTAWPAAAVGGTMFGASAIAVIVLTLATAPNSRLRYGSYAAVSVAVAIAALVLVNIIAQTDYYRRDCQSLGRYGISKRTKTILANVDEPIRLSCVFTATDDQTRSLYRPRTLEMLGELCEEVRSQNGQATLDNITNDTQKAQLVARLRAKQETSAGEQVRFIRSFQSAKNLLVGTLQDEQDKWTKLPDDSYLSGWGMNLEIASAMKKHAEEIENLDRSLQRKMTALPDHSELVKDICGVLTGARDDLQAMSDDLEKIGALPAGVRAGRAKADKALDEAVKAVEHLQKVVGVPGQAAPAKPTETLKKFVAAATKATEKLIAAGETLRNFAGKDNEELLQRCRLWQVRVPGDLAGKYVATGPPPEALLHLAGLLNQALRMPAAGIIEAANVEYQKKFILQARKSVRLFARDTAAVHKTVNSALDVLQGAEKNFSAIPQGYDGKSIQVIIAPIAKMLSKADNLPKPKSEKLDGDITRDNLVVLEVGPKVRIVPFEELWPLKMPGARAGRGGKTKEQRRFAGDSAIGSRILSMTHEPFATVVLTYFEPEVPPQMARMMPPPSIPVSSIHTLRKRLEEANLKIEEWNLAKDDSPQEESNSAATQGASTQASATKPSGPQKVLLILPPPQMMPIFAGQPMPGVFAKRHVEKIRKNINAGTPAIFICHYMPPLELAPTVKIEGKYGLNDYLRKDWGLDVQANYIVIPAEPSETEPGRFGLNPVRYMYYPLSTFTDQPIGKPLQGARVFWYSLCPVGRARGMDGKYLPMPKGISEGGIQPILTVDASAKETWATEDRKRIEMQLYTKSQSYISPQKNKDIMPPFDIAVAGVREKTPGTSPTRIVVLTMGASFIDRYLNGPVPQIEDNTLRMTDPPRADADVVINSVYWTIGNEDYIAAGPAQFPPIRMISPQMRTALWVILAVALPLVVLAIGGVVMLFRKR